MNIDRRRGVSNAGLHLSYSINRVGRWVLAVLLVLIVAILGLVLGIGLAHADATAGSWPQSQRIGADGTCRFVGTLAAYARAEVSCFTGQAIAPPLVAQVETGDAQVIGFLVTAEPGVIVAALINADAQPIAAAITVRAFVAQAAAAHPCALPPPPQPWTLRDRCIQNACAAGQEPVCTVKTSAAGTGMPAAN